MIHSHPFETLDEKGVDVGNAVKNQVNEHFGTTDQDVMNRATSPLPPGTEDPGHAGDKLTGYLCTPRGRLVTGQSTRGVFKELSNERLLFYRPFAAVGASAGGSIAHGAEVSGLYRRLKLE
jgi:hypothetical protein